MLKTIFWGNSEFVLPSLEIIHEKTNLLAIFTGKDKPFGRNKKKIKIPEPKIFATEKNIPVFQPESLGADEEKIIKDLNPDLMIVISYGKLIPLSIYNIPRLKTINIHGSLLPLYRGASPIQQSLLSGDLKTGVSIQIINEKMDEGNLLLNKSITIEKKDQYVSLREKLSNLSATALGELFELEEKNQFPNEKLQEGEASYCHKISKDQGKILWDKEDAIDIYNKWRAFYLWPNIFCYHKKNLLKLNEIELVEDLKGTPGEIIQADKNAFIVSTKNGAIKINKVQPANKRAMPFRDFLNGNRIKTGEILS